MPSGVKNQIQITPRSKIKRVGVDMDGILANLHIPWIEWYNKEWNDKLKLTSVTDWYIHKFTKPSCQKKMYQYLELPDLYRTIKPLKGAMAGMERLAKAGIELIIVTHAMGGPATMADKAEWLDQYLPNSISRENVVYTSQKHLLKLDALIDDSPINLRRQREYWPETKLLTIAYPFNKSVADIVDLRAQSFKDTSDAWTEIVKWIKEYNG